MHNVLIIGATSAIAQHTARLLAARGAAFYLVARDAQKLAVVAEDLKVRTTSRVETCEMDVLEFERHAPVFEQALAVLGDLDVVLIAHGSLPNQQAGEACAETMRHEMQVNALSTLSILGAVANFFETRGAGSIVVISSVAGDRGRKSNYIYGSAKAAVSVYLQGLRNRLASRGVQVLTVKPGFVDTPMTAEFDKGFLWTGPDTVAEHICHAIESGKDVIYSPWFWRWIMALIKLVPERLFKRLNL